MDQPAAETVRCGERSRSSGTCPSAQGGAYNERALVLRRRLTFDGIWPEWDNPTMVVTLDAKRRLTVPTALAPAKPGDYFDARFDAEEDAIVFRRLGGRENWLAVMKECPVSPDDVPPRRRELSKRRKL